MKTILPLILCLMLFSHLGNSLITPAMALDREANPVISLTVKDEPLADALDTISEKTGYQFQLAPKWQLYPVSATIIDLPLEKGLKRLLKSLNHTIIWESDDTIVIKVFGKSEAGRSSNAISFSEPPQPESIPEPENTLMDTQEEEDDIDQNGPNDEEESSDLNAADPEESE